MLALAVILRQRADVGEPHVSSRTRLAAPSPERYGVGRVATPSEITQRDITVFPSGAGLPVGRGNAVRGEQVYATECAGCHGVRGEGGQLGPALVGGIGSLDTERPKQTVGSYWPYATSVFDYTRRAMPYQAPGSLSADDVYAVTAYTLYLSGIVGKHHMLDEKTLPAVKMPNRDGFITDPRPDVHAQR
ncbi:MAG: c-type cytochrome [Luteitalea sp.]|nr:c-type cytochrome [Luteitalea sp.]